MANPGFTWADIIGAANSFLENPFVSGCIIVILALGVVTKLADFLKGVVDGD
jgi:hypothetical protein